MNAVFSPVLFDTDAGDTSLGQFGPDEVVRGFEKLDRTQATLGAAQLFRGRLWADQVLLSFDASWTRISDIPGRGETPLTANDEDSWGYQVQFIANYSGLFGGVNIAPFFVYTHDVDGTTPAPLSTFLEDRKTLAVGLRASYINRITAELRFTSFFHGGRANQLRDRDYLRFQLNYYL